MEELRILSRTTEGKSKIRTDEGFYRQLGELLSRSQVAKEVDDGIATLANLFSEDSGDGAVLKLCLANVAIFDGIIGRLRARQSFVYCSVCITNCWKQGAQHRQALVKLGVLEALLTAVDKNASVCVQAMSALRGMLEDTEEGDGISIVIKATDIERICSLISDSDSSDPQRAGALRLLITGPPFVLLKSVEASGSGDVKEMFSTSIVKGLQSPKLEDSTIVDVVDFIKATHPTHEWLCRALVAKSGLIPALKTLMVARKADTSSPVLLSIADLFASLTASQPGSEDVFVGIFEQDLDDLWQDLITSASAMIPHEASKRVRDQSLVLPHAKLRLSLLTATLHVSTSESRSRRLVSKQVHQLVSDIAIKYMEYDVEAVRCCANILRNLTLANSRTVILETALPATVSALLRSQDHHTAFIAAGIFRLACSRSGRADRDSWARLVVDGRDLLAMLSLDLTRIHPHTRVELARALAALMEGITAFEGSVPALETVQAVKFVAFLFEAPQPELHLEALQGLDGLPEEFLKALPSFEIEIVPGTRLVQRLKDIHVANRDDLDVKRVAVAASCQKLLLRMGVEV